MKVVIYLKTNLELLRFCWKLIGSKIVKGCCIVSKRLVGIDPRCSKPKLELRYLLAFQMMIYQTHKILCSIRFTSPPKKRSQQPSFKFKGVASFHLKKIRSSDHNGWVLPGSRLANLPGGHGRSLPGCWSQIQRSCGSIGHQWWGARLPRWEVFRKLLGFQLILNL